MKRIRVSFKYCTGSRPDHHIKREPGLDHHIKREPGYHEKREPGYHDQAKRDPNLHHVKLENPASRHPHALAPQVRKLTSFLHPVRITSSPVATSFRQLVFKSTVNRNLSDHNFKTLVITRCKRTGCTVWSLSIHVLR